MRWQRGDRSGGSEGDACGGSERGDTHLLGYGRVEADKGLVEDDDALALVARVENGVLEGVLVQRAPAARSARVRRDVR